LYTWPFRYLQLPELAGKVEYVQLLNDASEITFKQSGEEVPVLEEAIRPGCIELILPVVKPDVVVPVVEIYLKS
jgi:alpha-L-fucosidase